MTSISMHLDTASESASLDINLTYFGETDPSTGLQSGYGYQVYPNGRIAYSGTWLGGKRFGHGQTFLSNGSLTYDGQFRHGHL